MATLKHGIEEVYYATIDFSGVEPVYNTPIASPGARSMTPTVDQALTRLYADNDTYFVKVGKKETSGEYGAYYFPKSYSTDVLGYKGTTAGGITDTGVNKPHALMYIQKVVDKDTREVTEELTILYNVIGSAIQEEAITDESEISETEFVMPFIATPSSFVKDDDGVPVTMYKITKTEANASLFDTFKTVVLLPTDVVI